MIDYKELLAFKTLAETLHFSRASELCYMSASALTRLVQKLEHSLDTCLFERNNRSIKLTESGKIYYQFVTDVLQKHEDLRVALHPDDENIVGHIKLFCTVTASYVVLPDIIRHLHKAYPKIKIQLTTGSITHCTSQLETQQTDVVISILSDTIPSTYAIKPLLTTQMVLVTPKSKSINTIEEATEQLEFIKPSHFIGNTDINTLFSKLGITPRIHSEVDGNEAILSLISAGMGMSVLPEIVLEHSHLAQYVNILARKPLPTIDVGLIIKKTSLHSPVKEKFWQVCNQIHVGTDTT